MRTEKQQQRLEKKRKKLAAYLEISKLNDKDRENKTNSLTIKREPDDEEECNESDPKRLCTEKKEENKNNNLLKPILERDDYLELRRQLKERKKILKTIPRFTLNAAGENARINSDVNSEDRIPIFLNDIQHLLIYSSVGNNSPYSPARWCTLEKHNRVSHTVVIVIEGLTSYHFSSYESLFPNINKYLEYQLEMVTPISYGGSITEELSVVPLTNTQKTKIIYKHGSLESAYTNSYDLIKLMKSIFPMRPPVNPNGSLIDQKILMELPPTDRFSRIKLLLSPIQLIDENYPLPLCGSLANKYKDYKLTKDCYLQVSSKSPMFGLDCEMCRTTSGELELTRISVVDEKMNLVYESLVKPDNKIIDYLTKYSGITPSMLYNVKTTLNDVQNILKDILPPDAILVGQSLNSDLHCLKLMHPYIIDTSVIYNITGDRYRKTKLQILAKQFLHIDIQQSNKKGHCSIEDSQTSLKLAQLKLANSIEFGDAVLSGYQKLENDINKQKYLNNSPDYALSIFKHVTKVKKTCSIIGNSEIMNQYSKYLTSPSLSVMDHDNFNKNDDIRLVVTDSNEQTIERSSQIAMEHALTFSHIKLTDENLSDDKIEETCKNVNNWVQDIWDNVAINGLVCLIFAGQNNAATGACFINLKKNVKPPISFNKTIV